MMFSKFKLETSFGELDFAIIQLSPWIKAYNSILWIAVVLSNALSLAYIIKKLNTSNLINLIVTSDPRYPVSADRPRSGEG